MPWYDSPQFLELQQAWYERLRAAGFQDIEEFVGDDLRLRQSAEHVYRNVDELGRVTKAAYFAILAQKVHDSQFSSELDRLILVRHAEGLTNLAIVRELEQRGQGRCHRNTVMFTIRKYLTLWKIRVYSPRQLNQKK